MQHIDLPALGAGIIVAVYWARVLRLALKFRRRTGRAANFFPPESLGRLLRLVWFPTVLLWIVIPFIVAFATKAPAPLRRLYQQPIIEWIGFALASAALVATFICWKKMGRSWRMGIDPQERTDLVVTGPYAYVRHPIYALSSLLMVSTLAAVPTAAMIGVAMVHLLLVQWEARREERYLVSMHGDEYQSYMKRVGRFIPRRLSPQ